MIQTLEPEIDLTGGGRLGDPAARAGAGVFVLDRHHRFNPSLHELLIALVRRERKRTLPPEQAAILLDPPRRESLLLLAARHFVHGLALSRLAALDPVDDDHEAIRTRSRITLQKLCADAALWNLERDRLLKLLALRGASPLLLKGAALRCTVYADPVERPLGDIDLLVPASDVDLAISIVGEMGYRAPYTPDVVRQLREHHFHLRVVRDQFVVEIHWALGKASQPFDLDAHAFLENARCVDLPSLGSLHRRARVPAAEDMVLHLVSQNLHHGTRLGRLVDIDRLAEASNLDWEALRDRADGSGLEVALAVDVRLCQSLLETPVPEGFVSGLGLSDLRRRNLAILRPETWAFSSPTTPVTLMDLRRRWCISDEFRRSNRPGEHLLQWIWPDELMAVARPSPYAKTKRVGKLLAYQAWVYLRAGIRSLRPAGRGWSRFWQRPAPGSPREAHGSG